MNASERQQLLNIERILDELVIRLDLATAEELAERREEPDEEPELSAA